MERLGDSARRLLAASGVPDPGPLSAIAEIWPEAVGDAISRVAWPKRVARDGTLHVSTASATWAFELSRLANDIHERLVVALGDKSPIAIRFAQGPVPEPPAPPETASRPRPAATHADRLQADKLAAAIADPALRDLVARAAAASLASARRDRSFC
jgi:hypothetical protein